MKRLVAVLLSAVMVLSLPGCSKKAEETTKKTKKTKDTKVTETEEPETTEEDTSETEPTETEEPETSETEASSSETKSGNTITDFSISPDFKITSDLKKLDFELQRALHVYGFLNESNSITTLRTDTDIIDIKDPNLDQLWNSVTDGICGNLDSNYEQVFDEKIASYADGSAAGSFSLTSHCYIVRADSQTLSFVNYQSMYDAAIDSEVTTYKTINFRTGDSMPISLDDVVTDRAGFADFFKSYLSGTETYKNNSLMIDFLEKQIRDENAEVNFLLTYDGIFVVYTEEYQFAMFKIPAAYAADYLDLEYFGATPEYYALQSDARRQIAWDIDGDGKLEVISAEVSEDEYENVIGLQLTVNGQKVADVPQDALEFDAMYFYNLHLLKTDSGFYVYADMSLESSDGLSFVFKLDGTNCTYVDTFYGDLPYITVSGYLYDPENFTVSTYSDILGTHSVANKVSAIGNNGMPKKTEVFGAKGALVVTKAEIAAEKCDANGKVSGAVTIPANTSCQVLGTDLETGKVLCMAVNADASQNYYFIITFDTGNSSFSINGVSQNDLFYGLFFAG